jgi:hypothetical protein
MQQQTLEKTHWREGGFVLEGFPFQICNQQKLCIGYTSSGVKIHSFIQPLPVEISLE